MTLRTTVIAAAFLSAMIASGASAQIISACVRANGTIKIVSDPADCSDRETPLSWNEQDPYAPRFEDCGDGTVADHRTGLQWEKKTGTWSSPGVYCDTVPCPDPHDVNNKYRWSSTGTEPDGSAFTDFLARLNAKFRPRNPTGCFTGRCDWRLPEISELQTILIGQDAAPGQATTCPTAPCIDPDFAAVGGPTAPLYYWSASTYAPLPRQAWRAYFLGLGVVLPHGYKTFDVLARAVRAGSCN